LFGTEKAIPLISKPSGAVKALDNLSLLMEYTETWKLEPNPQVFISFAV